MLNTLEICEFKTERTPFVGERVGILYVPESKFRDDTVTAYGTSLQDFMPGVAKPGVATRGYGGYLLTDTVEAPDGYLGFTFAKPKTAKQRQTPFNVQQITDMYYWPPWLVSLYALEDASVPMQVPTATGLIYQNRIFDRYAVIEGGNYASNVTIEEFLSPEPFPAEELQYITPVPTLIQYNFLGTQMNLTCLHEEVLVPEVQTEGAPVEGFGTADARPNGIGDRFPATNLPGWTTHVFANDSKFTDGVYYRVKKTVTPMYIPEPLQL